jgi:hypothetical protein
LSFFSLHFQSESADKVEEGEGDAKKARKGPGLSSSPILTSTVLPSRFKINNHHDRSLFTSKSSGTKTGKNDHADLDVSPSRYTNLLSQKAILFFTHINALLFGLIVLT